MAQPAYRRQRADDNQGDAGRRQYLPLCSSSSHDRDADRRDCTSSVAAMSTATTIQDSEKRPEKRKAANQGHEENA